MKEEFYFANWNLNFQFQSKSAENWKSFPAPTLLQACTGLDVEDNHEWMEYECRSMKMKRAVFTPNYLCWKLLAQLTLWKAKWGRWGGYYPRIRQRLTSQQLQRRFSNVFDRKKWKCFEWRKMSSIYLKVSIYVQRKFFLLQQENFNESVSILFTLRRKYFNFRYIKEVHLIIFYLTNTHKIFFALNINAKHNKFALLWGEAQLCLPYVCL